jgi:hypothetical protein
MCDWDGNPNRLRLVVHASASIGFPGQNDLIASYSQLQR